MFDFIFFEFDMKMVKIDLTLIESHLVISLWLYIVPPDLVSVFPCAGNLTYEIAQITYGDLPTRYFFHFFQ